LLAESWPPQFVCADWAAVSPGTEAGGSVGAQLVTAPLIEVIKRPGAGVVPGRTVVPVSGLVETGPTCDIFPGAGGDVCCETRPASCLLTRFNAEPNADPALTVAVAEFAFNKTDSAAAWAKAEGPAKAIANVKIIPTRMHLFICNSSS